jgi:hypothetical protein
VCSINGPNLHGTWTRTSSGVFTVVATGPAGTLVGGLPAIFLPTTAGVEGFACGAVTATLQTTCTGATVGNLLLGATVTVRFPLVGGGTADVTGTVTAPAAAVVPTAAVPVNVFVNQPPPPLPPPPPPPPLPLLPPPPPFIPGPSTPLAGAAPFPPAPVAPEVPVIPEADGLSLVVSGLVGLVVLSRLSRRWRPGKE